MEHKVGIAALVVSTIGFCFSLAILIYLIKKLNTTNVKFRGGLWILIQILGT